MRLFYALWPPAKTAHALAQWTHEMVHGTGGTPTPSDRIHLTLAFLGEADPGKAQICHCTDCQQLSGSAFRIGIRVASDDFRMLSGEPTIYVKTAESGAKSAQAFCPRCGSPIYATRFGDAPKFYNIRLGTVRQRDQFVPKLQFWSRSELHWLPSLATIRTIEKQEWRTAPRSPA